MMMSRIQAKLMGSTIDQMGFVPRGERPLDSLTSRVYIVNTSHLVTAPRLDGLEICVPSPLPDAGADVRSGLMRGIALCPR